MTNQNCLIFCNCTANVVSSGKKDKLINVFRQLDIDVKELHDLCAFSVHNQLKLTQIGKQYARKLIVACYPRAVQNMLIQGGVDFGKFEVLNFKVFTVSEIEQKLKAEFSIAEGKANYEVIKSELDTPAWFPVIDQSRCTLCGKCARFCLFGVYQFDKKKLKVENPLACKNLCPACGRTCPSQAIMFPRLRERSVLAGDKPTETQPTRIGENDSLLVMLNERNQKRKSIIREHVVKLAEEEREKALQEIKNSKQKGN